VVFVNGQFVILSSFLHKKRRARAAGDAGNLDFSLIPCVFSTFSLWEK
jgi:hypothetical protein